MRSKKRFFDNIEIEISENWKNISDQEKFYASLPSLSYKGHWERSEMGAKEINETESDQPGLRMFIDLILVHIIISDWTIARSGVIESLH